MFQENHSLLCVFSATFFRKVPCVVSLLYLALRSFQGTFPRPVGLPQPLVAGLGLRWLPPAQLSWAVRPTSFRARENEGTAPLGPAARWALRTLRQLSLLAEAVAAQANVEPSLEGRLELAGVQVGRGKCRGGWRREPNGGVSLTQAPRMLDKTEFFGRTSSHPSYFFFTFVIYVFIRSFEYWYLLLKGLMWCFAVELVFGFLQMLWVIDLPLGSRLTSIHYNILWTHVLVT